MTRVNEVRRIEAAIEHRNQSELEWALQQCEVQKRYAGAHSGLWYRLEKRVRAMLDEIQREPSTPPSVHQSD